MKRRHFITLLGGATTWPLAARAQLARLHRVGVLMSLSAEDPESQTRLAAFVQGLQELGWMVGRNLRIDTRWGAGKAELYRKFAAELVALAPDVILAGGGITLQPLLQATMTLPIVFASTTDPVAEGAVESLARPGGNATGFMNFEYGISSKWLEILKQIAPRLTRVAVFRDAAISSGIGQFAVIQAVAPSFGVELTPYDTRDAAEIERAFTDIAQRGIGGLIVTASSPAANYRDLIVGLVARHGLPAVYGARYFVTAGGMISYGPDFTEGFRRAASYVDRILRGEKAADLPVQAPTTYGLAINLKTAKALGIEIPSTMRALANEVIE